MGKELPFITSFVLATALLAESAACNPKPKEPQTAEPQRTFEPTQIPIQDPQTATTIESATSTATSTPEWQKPIEERFRLGSFNVGSTTLEIGTTEGLMKAMNSAGIEKYTTKPPLWITTDYLPKPGDGGAGDLFEESAKKDGGRTPELFLTDRPNILLFFAHSESVAASGEIARKIGSFVMHNSDNTILGKNLTLKTGEGQTLTGIIEFVKTVSEAEFDNDTGDQRFWGLYSKKDNIVFFMTDKAGIPDSIRNDDNSYYLILATCTPKDGEPINLNPLDPNRVQFNTAERSYIVIRLVIP